MTLITKAINDHVSGKIPLPPIYNDMFPAAGTEGVVSRHDPSSARGRSYIDGSAEGTLNIGYWARFRDAEDCRKILTDILDSVDGLELSCGDGTSVEVEATTLPQFVGTDDKGLTTYTAGIKASYERLPAEGDY